MEVLEEFRTTGRRLVIYNDGVYDVGEFLDMVKHLGGNDLIEANFGTDITAKMEEEGHSPNAYRILARYKVGVISRQRKEIADEKGHGHGVPS